MIQPQKGTKITKALCDFCALLWLFLPAAGDLTDALDGFEDVRERVGVTEPEIAFAVFTESRPPEGCHTGFIQQEIGKFLRRLLRSCDVRERIESARGN